MLAFVAASDVIVWLVLWGVVGMDPIGAMFVLVAMPLIGFLPLIRDRRSDEERGVEAIRSLPLRWVTTALTLIFVLVIGAIWYARPAMLYVSNHGELELQPQDGLVSVIVLQNDEGVRDENKLHPAVTDWLSMKGSHTLKLPPGKYQLNAGASGTPINHWKVTTSGAFGSDTRLVPGEGLMGWSVIVTVERGCRVSVQPVMSARNPFPYAATPPNPSSRQIMMALSTSSTART